MARRIIAALMLALTLALTFVPTFAATSDGTSMPLDTTTVEQDFLVSGFDPEDFYKEHTTQEPTIAFTTDYYDDYYLTNPDGGNFYLYVWIYYPNMSDIDKGLLKNNNGLFEVFINTNVKNAFDEIITNLGGVYLGSDSTYTFHKVRVDCSMLNLNIENERKYEILSFEFNDTKFACSKTYVFNGTHKDKNIVANTVFDQVVHLEPKDTVYITASSPNPPYRTAVYSVYFTVPKEYENKNNFDYLRAIEFSHYEQLFNAVVTSEDNVWEELETMKDVEFLTDMSAYDSNYPNIYSEYQSASMGSGNLMFRYAINPRSGLCLGLVDPEVLNMFKVANYKDENLLIPFEKIEKFFDYTETGADSNLFNNKIYIDDTFNVESYSGDHKDFWDSLTAILYGFNDMYEANLENVSPIVKVDDSFFTGYNSNLEKWCGDHLIAEQDAEDFKAAYDKAKNDGDVLYVFRFAQRNYYAQDCVILETDLFELADENGFYVRATAFNDFDIISLTYRDEKGDDIVVPVNMTPIDIGPDIQGPTRTTWSDFEIFLGDLFEPILTLLGILFVLLLIIILAKPVGWIIDRLFGRRKQ